MDFLLLVNILLSIVSVVRSQSISTVPDTESGDAFILTENGEINVTVVCTVFDSSNQIQTPWRIQRQGEDQMLRNLLFAPNGVSSGPTDVIGDLFATGELISGISDTFLTNLTFLNFTIEFDTTQLQCGDTALETRNFFLGFPVSPLVNDIISTQFVIEGGDITVNLKVSGAKDSFPPVTTSVWIFNGRNLTDSGGIILNDFGIMLNSVQRNMSGNYSLTVTNSVGSATGSFDLDVQFPSEALSDGGSEIVLTGSSIVLTAFLSPIGGNPLPTISWTGPDGEMRNTSGRFNTSVPGQITVMNIMNADNGTYTCNISNGISPDLSQTVELIFAVPAGPPQNLMERDVTDTTVNLTWSPPDNLGLPELSFYQLKVTPPPPSDVNLTTTSTSLLVYGIIPNTWYNVTVVGVSTGNNFDILKGEESNQITFQTMTGAPRFQNVTATPINGSIEISWTFRHTGGLSVDLDIYCQIVEEGSGSRITDNLSCESNGCVNDNLMGSTTLSPVYAGETYFCSVTAINSDGSDSRNFTNIAIIEGLPSTPMISYNVSAGLIRLTLSVQSSGTSSGNIWCIVNISVNGKVVRTDQIHFLNYKNGQEVTVDVSIPEGGSFDLTIITRNVFGNSEEVIIEGVTVPPVSTSSTTSTTTSVETTIVTPSSGTTLTRTRTSTSSRTSTTSAIPTGTSESSALPGGAIAGIVIAIIILVAIIAIVAFIVFYIIYQNRGGSYQVEAGKRGGIKVEELDIDIGTELKNTETTEGLLEKPPTTSETSTSAEPRQELHYADLADFGPIKSSKGPSAPAPQAKPMPIEEVQYAVIVPQSQKPPAEDGAE